MHEKLCKFCDKTLPLESFVKSTTIRSGYRNICKPCRNAYYAQRRIDHYEKVREYEKKFHRKRALKYNYGITEEDYVKMLEAQGGGCYICATTPEENGKMLAVDHCHGSNRVRGLLCSKCNAGLGLFKDNPAFLKKAISYLESS